MRIFRIVTYLLFLNLIFPEQEFHVVKSLDSSKIEIYFDSLSALNPHLNKEYTLIFFNKNPPESIYSGINKPLEIDTILYKYPSNLNSSLVRNMFSSIRYLDNITSIEKNLKKISNRYSFISKVPNYNIGLVEESIGLLIDFEPDFQNTISGLIGLAKTKNSDWGLNGEFDMHIENLWGSGGEYTLLWKSSDSLSHKYNISITEPHPFGLKTGLKYSYDYELFDGFYIYKNIILSIRLPINTSGLFSVGLSRENTIATGKGIQNNYSSYFSKSIQIEYDYDSRNHRYLPRSGYRILINSNFGISKPSSKTFLRLNGQFEKYFKINRLVIFKNSISSGLIESSSSSNDDIKKFNLSGSNNLKGYQENQFITSRYLLLEEEAFYDISSIIRMGLFSSFLTLKNDKTIHSSLGVSLSQIKSNSLIKLYYVFTKENQFKKGNFIVMYSTIF